MNELYLYDIIGYGEATPIAVREAMAKAESSKPLTVRINSEGGSAFDGFAIFNALKSHAAGVTVYVDGIAASAASVIAMAGSKIVMGPMSYLMIHEAWGGFVGNKRDFRKQAELLENIDNVSIEQYARRTKIEADKVREWLEAETWWNAQQAVDAGMADELAGEQQAIAFVEIDQKNETGNRWGYRNVPKTLLVDPAIAMQRRGRQKESPKPSREDEIRRQRLRMAKAG